VEAHPLEGTLSRLYDFRCTLFSLCSDVRSTGRGWGRGEWGAALRLVALPPDWSVGISTVDPVTYVGRLMQSDYYGLKSMTLSFFAENVAFTV